MITSKMFDKYHEEYLKFERIPEDKRLAPQEEVCGIVYICNLMKDPKKFTLSAEPDIIYLVDIALLRELTIEDVIYLTRCGIHYDNEYDCLAISA